METYLITGANRGIGFALVQQCLANGHRVIATYRDQSAANALFELAGESCLLELVQAELDSETGINKLANEIADKPLDVLINNAGIMGPEQQDLNGLDSEGWLATFAINTIAPFHVSRLLLPNLLHSARPRIITISSQMGSLARESTGSYAYRSSKAAVNKVMQVMATELAEQGVIVCPMHPGWVQTDMGGMEADISAQQSAAGIIRFVEGVSLAESGRFWTWQGEEHPW
ncbi:SDR family oxidoreductase [Motilimonas sp. KMU-193]|uniref:SDR family oxidoreductase n=1 Tax=Motilimonas sp. KMU-193 TaxID=3388668 RepID=UPI00396B4285